MEELEKLLNINKKSLKIFLEVSSSNKFAIKLYEKLGYKAYNERKNYYRSKSINAPHTQDAILFAKSLNAIR
jgi:ribosomal protein S18 acetylase RimI-like enzyme